MSPHPLKQDHISPEAPVETQSPQSVESQTPRTREERLAELLQLSTNKDIQGIVSTRHGSFEVIAKPKTRKSGSR